MCNSSLRICFAGTSSFSASHLEVLLNSSHEVICIFTKPDRPSGRKNKIKINEVKKLALQYDIPIFQPNSINDIEIWRNIKQLKTDIIVVVAYGLIFSKEILNLSRLGSINVHCSLLPRWRGAAPIQRALLAGDRQTGVTVIQMDSGLDTGPIVYQSICDISKTETSATLSDKLTKIGTSVLLIALKKIASGKKNNFFYQKEELAIYAKKLNKKEAKINWYLSASQLERYIRAFNPWPVSYFNVNKKKVKVWNSFVSKHKHNNIMPGTILDIKKTGMDITTGNFEILTITNLQLEGKRAIFVKDLLNSKLYQNYFFSGKVLD